MAQEPRKLPESAHRELREGETYTPYVPANQSPGEFTIKALLFGILFGVLFGAANAYLGLRAGLTISTSIPVAVMTVAAFQALRRFGGQASILEANLSQTVGSASSSVASGVIFTLPALFLWGLSPSLLQMTLLAMAGGLLGILFMIPLRRFLIQREHGRLPYPEGTACAHVLVANESGGHHARNVFIGLGAGAAWKALTSWLKVLPAEAHLKLPFLKKGELGMDLSPALFGVGYILGPRIATVMVGGGLLSSLVLIPGIAIWGEGRPPMYPELVMTISEMSASQIWTRYVRYIGAGAVAAAGIITLVRSLPVMIESFRIGAGELRNRVGDEDGAEDLPRTARELPLKAVGIGVVLIGAVLAFVPAPFGALDSGLERGVAAICVIVFAFFFVTVASRIVGLVGVTSNPTSGMTIAALLGTSGIFLLMGWTDMTGKAAALTVGCVVAIAASIAGDTSQDLKTGYLLGATPRNQQIGELVGVLTSATFVCLSVLLLAETFGFGSEELPAPQATLMKLVIDGVLEQNLPWGLVAIGAGIAIIAELCRIPSLPFAVGVYLPVSTMTPIFLGGMLKLWLEKKAASEEEAAGRRDRGVLLGSGFVGGEGLLGVAIAGVAFWQGARPAGIGTGWLGPDWLVNLAGFIFFMVFAAWFVKRARG
ncbi:oligopeptide transporter, OPT family [Marinihelvus fidelis]|uniref:Oligopeptide transporter, OPT family n=1 Tax=Marinihelvus fidelis TaxID=2613842 RepID=A0A5N0TFF5_9GAMM|nr:oligopeptide transporter, OPT family [Marinihelvus fidelis]KAA9133351.1 oligopeptide transporter, OPT family [Marinihelvus fidelis]